MKYPFTVFLILILNFFCAASQDTLVTKASYQNLCLNLRNINFVRNNEYSNPVSEGYTLIGYFLQPELVYDPTSKVTLRAGAHLLSYSGNNKFTLIKPLFSIRFNFSKNSFFIMGSLGGSDEHRMFDPHFSRERLYNSYSEDGVQLRLMSDQIFNDTWLSWENYIFKGDTEREIFTAGESFKYTSPLIANLVRIEIPFQLQFKHYGGQISNYPELVETYLNIATGATLGFDFTSQENGMAGFEYLFFTGSSITRNAPTGIKSGFAHWYQVFYACKKAQIKAGFWSSDDFFAPNGNYVFGSVSDHLENVIIHNRKIITGSVNIRLLPENFLELYFGFDGYYSTDLKRFDNALTLHLRFDKLFRITALGDNY